MGTYPSLNYILKNWDLQDLLMVSAYLGVSKDQLFSGKRAKSNGNGLTINSPEPITQYLIRSCRDAKINLHELEETYLHIKGLVRGLYNYGAMWAGSDHLLPSHILTRSDLSSQADGNFSICAYERSLEMLGETGIEANEKFRNVHIQQTPMVAFSNAISYVSSVIGDNSPKKHLPKYRNIYTNIMATSFIHTDWTNLSAVPEYNYYRDLEIDLPYHTNGHYEEDDMLDD